MYCSRCGNRVDGQNFCTVCGNSVNQANQYQAPATGMTSSTQTTFVGDSMSTALSSGTTHHHASHQAQRPRKNNMAIIGFIFAIIGLGVPVFEILGLVFSIVGLAQAKKLGGAGRGIAIAGMIIAIIGIVLLVPMLEEWGILAILL